MKILLHKLPWWRRLFNFSTCEAVLKMGNTTVGRAKYDGYSGMDCGVAKLFYGPEEECLEGSDEATKGYLARLARNGLADAVWKEIRGKVDEAAKEREEILYRNVEARIRYLIEKRRGK